MNRDRRNFSLGVANGLLFIFSETLMDPTLVLVSFLSQLTGSPVLLGLVIPLRDGSWALPQLWVSGLLQSIPRKIDMYRRLSYVRITCWGLLALAINLIRQPGLLLVSFFVVFTVSSLASGFSGLPFLETVGKTIPAHRRGEFFAWRYGLGGLLSIGASGFVRLLINPNGPVAFPHNFGILSAMYFVIASISLLLFNRVEEPEDLHRLPRDTFSNQLSRGLAFFRGDPNFRRFLINQSTLTIASMATPFFAIYVQQSLGGSKAMVGVYLAVIAGTNLLSNLFYGRLSRRLGNRPVLLVTTLAGSLMSLLVLLLALLARSLNLAPQAASLWLVPVFMLSGLRNTGMGISGNSLLLDIAPVKDRSTYLGFSNTFLGLVILSTSLGGVIMAFLGFKLLVVLTLAAHLAAFFAARGLRFQVQPMQEPVSLTN